MWSPEAGLELRRTSRFRSLTSGVFVHAIAGALYKDLGFDPVNSFAPIAAICTDSMALAVSPSIPADSRKWLRHSGWREDEFPLRKDFAARARVAAETLPPDDYPFVTVAVIILRAVIVPGDVSRSNKSPRTRSLKSPPRP